MEGDEQEMLRLQDSMALIPLVSSRIFTLIESEDDTRSWEFFLSLLLKLYHNAIPSRGLGIHIYRLLAT
jgi:hypothetical protein